MIRTTSASTTNANTFATIGMCGLTTALTFLNDQGLTHAAGLPRKPIYKIFFVCLLAVFIFVGQNLSRHAHPSPWRFCGRRHANISLDAVFASACGDWKLGGLELLSTADEVAEHVGRRHDIFSAACKVCVH